MFGSIKAPTQKEMDKYYPNHCQHHLLQGLLPAEWEEPLPESEMQAWGLGITVTSNESDQIKEVYLFLRVVWVSPRAFFLGTGKLGLPGSGSIPHCEFESQFSLGIKVQGTLWTCGWEMLHQCFLGDKPWLGTWTRKYYIPCWHSLSDGVLSLHSFSVHDELAASSTEAAGGWKWRWIS